MIFSGQPQAANMRTQLFKIMNALARELYPLRCKCELLDMAHADEGFTVLVYAPTDNQLLFKCSVTSSHYNDLEDVKTITSQVLRLMELSEWIKTTR
jgi:hypothetical protein